MGASASARCGVNAQRILRFLLDEHYPAWLADELTADGVDTVALNAQRPELRGVDDRRVLEAAVSEGRIVVTEDVNTFSAAIALVPHHIGVVYCHHARFPRTRPGLNQLRKAIVALAANPPPGLGEHPVVWWLAGLEA
jgi:predicted nuclease of predicted toxin-antitoxin system